MSSRPRRSTRQRTNQPSYDESDDEPSSSSTLFNGMVFVICGKLSTTQAQIKSLITDNGGKVVTKPTDSSIGLVGGDGENGGKNLDLCKQMDLTVLKEEFIHKAIQDGKLPDQDSFKLSAPSSSSSDTSVTGKRKKSQQDADEKDKDDTSSKRAKPEQFSAPPPDASAPSVGISQFDPDSMEVEVDSAFNEHGARVYIENNVIYDALLNQSNIGNNNNKFYVNQLLVASNGKFVVVNRWGRVGASGQSKISRFDDVESAKAFFEKQFKAKTGYNWVDRHLSTPTVGKYAMLEKDYESASSKASKLSKSASTKNSKAESVVTSKLDPSVQKLITMIFDQDMMAKQLTEFNYDDQQLPLGKLTKRHISKGYQKLKEIADILINPSSVKNASRMLEDLSNEFYTLIPHRFSLSQRPKIINSADILKSRLDMVEQLMEIEIANALIEQVEQAANERANLIDKKYQSLNCNIKPLEDKEMVKLITKYLDNTHGKTHHFKVKIEDIYELERPNEESRIADKRNLGNIRLLWHGSRMTNFVGILSQGLRIAPPEAPVSGYMFGKGVYFADMVSKSANYCFAHISNNHGLLLLCEVALGEMNEKYQADYNAGNLPPGKSSTWGKGRTFPDENGFETVEIDGREVLVPCGGTSSDDSMRSSLLYNEFIVYSVEQVRMKYLVHVAFGR